MKICVISGSPKGENSITYQTVLFLQKKFPKCEFETLHVGQRIRSFEQDMSAAIETMLRADLLLFCYPVYTFIVPAQLHRFIELMKASEADFSEKMVAQICTSKHFYDVTAQRFIQENCDDMGMRYLGGLSADMDDLPKEKGQQEAISFWELVQWRAENCISLPRIAWETKSVPEYVRQWEQAPKKDGKEIVIVASYTEEDKSLIAMIEDFQAVAPYPTKLVNLMDYPFDGGCLGCFKCAVSGKCVYKDNFDEFLRNEIQTADATVYAFSIKDHSMGARMKLYDDRQFCNGHRTVTMGMPVGYLVYGDLAREANLSNIIEARADVGSNFLAGVATDAVGVEELAQTLEYAMEHKVMLPQTFWGIGGMKIFRDLIWVMRGMMKADHKFYKQHGMYDFPQKKRPMAWAMMLVGAILSNKKLVSKMGNKMTEGMLMPYKKVLDKL
ncbi:MAG: NAD(P)H-dependent oxidoreductase [Lachnospiraceae bacterium]|nr:NAD(P)H-dependent oxidoreductase [Lachnospiraceae bacterium]